jgi:transposase InsO family protein
MAALTPVGRRMLVDRVRVGGWTVAAAAEAMGVSQATAHKWLRRFREEGPEGLVDRSSRPVSHPRAVSAGVVRRVVMLRVRRRWGPHRISWVTGIPRSTVYKVLCRVGLNRLDRIDRPSRVQVRRYERSRPGELLHIDVKKLARVPEGGGWKTRGRSRHTKAIKNHGAGYDYLHVAVDDHSRIAYVEAHPDEKGATAAGFLDRATNWFGRHGVTIEGVLTDNAFCYRYSKAFHRTADTHRITRLRTRPYRPQTNGKAERFNRTLLEEWAYHQAYTSNQQRLEQLTRWLNTYNHWRPHGGLGGQPPASRL